MYKYTEQYREMRRHKKEQGICVYCKEKAVPGRTLCQYHIDYQAKERKALKEAKICPICRKEKLYGDERRCLECAIKDNQRQRERYWKDAEANRARIRASGKARTKRYKEQGLCSRCGRERDDKSKAQCYRCREYSRIRNYGKVAAI